jgi:ornithine carbamoyltransferase
VLYSIIEAATLMQFELRVACPSAEPGVAQMLKIALQRGANVQLIADPMKAAAGANVIVTDTWFSMGQQREPQKLQAILPYQVFFHIGFLWEV